MHLEKPYLTTIGKKKGKKKWASADAKHKSKSLDKDWNDLLIKWETKTIVKKKFKTESLSPTMETPRLSATERLPSLVTPGGECTKKAPMIYSGDKVLGVAVLHKSCLQPIFSQEEAIEVAKMRR